jgi:small GTP-binding protein
MIKKKVVMLGAFAVGKTSLVQRFVHSIFSDKYLTTIGVKIDQKHITLKGNDITLMLWDLYGEDDFMKVKANYLMGSSGYFIVADGTRAETIDVAEKLQQMASENSNHAPFILLINKHDLTDLWEVSEERLISLRNKGWKIMLTSARNNQNVDEAFYTLTEMMIARQIKSEP